MSKTTNPWYVDLFNKIKNFVGAIGGWIWDGIQWIWNTLKNIGDWIANTLTSLVKWIISVVKDIAGKVSHIVEGMLYGMPMLVILFSVSYFGEMLYKGHIPKLTKERRLLRKIRPRTILKQRAKYQRKLKYPVVQVKKARTIVRDWRTEQSERRTARYESRIHQSRSKELQYQEQTASSLRRSRRY